MRSNFDECCDGDVVQLHDEIVHIECPANCVGSLSIAVANSDGDKLEKEIFTHAKCCNCGLEIYSRPLIKSCYFHLLEKEKLQRFRVLWHKFKEVILGAHNLCHGQRLIMELIALHF